jgi:hypothetical protein
VFVPDGCVKFPISKQPLNPVAFTTVPVEREKVLLTISLKVFAQSLTV